MTQSLEQTVAIVTGAGSGIGAATAVALASHGAHVVVVGRRKDRLDATAAVIEKAGGSVSVAAADITDPAARIALIDGVVADHGRLDALINVAGVMYAGSALNATEEEWAAMIDLNVTALVQLTRLALPHLLSAAQSSDRKVADLVNVSSLSGRVSTAENSVYAGSKFAVTGFTEGIRREFTKRDVRVTLLEPGLVATDIFDNLRDEGADYFASIRDGVEILRPQDVAETIAFVVTRPRRVGHSEIVMRSVEQA